MPLIQPAILRRTSVAFVILSLGVGCSNEPSNVRPSTDLGTLVQFKTGNGVIGMDFYREKYFPLIRECLKKQGFDFVEPKLRVPGVTASTDTETYVDEFGFGVSTIVDPDNPDPWLPTQPGEDSTAESSAYRTALLGDDEAPGCLDKAAETIYGLDRDKFAATDRKMTEATKRFDASPEADALLQPWRKCIQQLGYEANSLDDFLALIGDELRVVISVSTFDSTGQIDPAKSAQIKERLAEVQARERKIAREELGCRDDSYRQYLRMRTSINLETLNAEIS